MNKILILFAHPRFEKSRINRALLHTVMNMPGVTVNDLYEEFPDFNIDVDREKKLLLDHQVIVWHHPVYMYGPPALLKQWIDVVLEHGWAHGKTATNLKGKIILNAVTAGGTRETYRPGGHNRFTMRQFLAPFEQTARLCAMAYLPPFVVHGTHLLTEKELTVCASLYRRLLEKLIGKEYDTEMLRRYEYLNDWLSGSEIQRNTGRAELSQI